MTSIKSSSSSFTGGKKKYTYQSVIAKTGANGLSATLQQRINTTLAATTTSRATGSRNNFVNNGFGGSLTGGSSKKRNGGPT